jgi:hypothetical protein
LLDPEDVRINLEMIFHGSETSFEVRRRNRVVIKASQEWGT